MVAGITGGPCKEFNYVLEQFQLHWGEDDAAGSEHLVNSTAYPAEVSCVDFEQTFKVTKTLYELLVFDAVHAIIFYIFYLKTKE